MRHKPWTQCWILSAALFAVSALTSTAAGLERFGINAATGLSQAVRVGDVALLHTAQLFAADASNEMASRSAAEQTARILDRLGAVLREAGSSWNRIVKLNLYTTGQDAVPSVRQMLADKFANENDAPAVSWVITKLPVANALVALDAVATTDRPTRESIARPDGAKPSWTIVPPGTRIYVSGQAEPGDSLAEMTRKTLTSLSATLKFLGRGDGDIVQIKAFLQPMRDVAEVRRAVVEYFGLQPVPPMVAVEWLGKRSIEIELIAWGGGDQHGPAVEYLTPPFLKASPIFSRVARINHSPAIYLSGLYAKRLSPTDASGAATAVAAEREVKEIFADLNALLQRMGSDWKHLVKATYYCATDAASQKLNELRPAYYDPARPPAASKAAVAGTGRNGLGLTLDMIAVPAP